jgi:cytochrome o ubiquinol oxidase subunit 3
MSGSKPVMHENFPDPHHNVYSKTIFGFWLYLLTDFVLFGTLFAAYAVLRESTFGGPSAGELFDLQTVLHRTLILIACSLTAGLAGASAHRRHRGQTVLFYVVTIFFSLLFMGFQIGEFRHLLSIDQGWEKSAFLSAYFTLVGTFALHVVFAILWTFVLVVPVCLRPEITGVDMRRLTCLRMFWQFLNIVWIFIFTFVYLLGGIRP